MMFGARTQAWQNSMGMVLAAWCSRAAGTSEQRKTINSVVVQCTGRQPQWGNSEVQTRDVSHGVAVAQCSKLQTMQQ